MSLLVCVNVGLIPLQHIVFLISYMIGIMNNTLIGASISHTVIWLVQDNTLMQWSDWCDTYPDALNVLTQSFFFIIELS